MRKALLAGLMFLLAGVVSAANLMDTFQEFSDKRVLRGSFGKARKASDRGDPMAKVFIAECYAKGICIQKDLREAWNFVNDAAGGGEPRALFLRGTWYAIGLGTARDFRKAVENLESAAENGYGRAEFNLGVLLFNGFPGRSANPAEGYYWVNRAASHADDDELASRAKAALAEFRKSMTPEDLEKAKEIRK